MEKWSLKTADIIDDETLLLVFEQAWFQDDIEELAKVILSKIDKFSIIEHAKGADRESVRFNWHGDICVLHFEFYSQSCWFEAELPTGTLLASLLALYSS